MPTVAATMGQVYNAVKTDGYRLADFRDEWAGLSDQDKAQLRQGVADGTLTY
jgi:hypothetical protein